MRRDEKYRDDLILRIYDTALDHSAWPDVLQEISHYCNAAGAFVFEMRNDQAGQHIKARHFSAIHDGAILNDYLALHREAELQDHEFFARRSQMTDRIELIPDADLIRESQAKGDIFERPHMKMQMQYGFKHRAGALLNKDDYFRDRIGMVYDIDYGPPQRADIAAAEAVLPHLAKALDVSRPATQAQAMSASIAKSIDHLNVGVCILDKKHRVVFRNIEFARQVSRYDAFKQEMNGTLVFNADRFDRSIVNLMTHHRNHGKFGARPRKEAVATAIDPSGQFALCVEIAPLRRACEFDEIGLDGHIIYSLDTSQSFDVRTAMIAEMFKLTKSEAEILQLMAEGLTNTQISDRRSKSIHTVNSQVKAVLSKTKTANRMQLIRLATNLSAGFGARRK